jgi:hypothetical protein
MGIVTWYSIALEGKASYLPVFLGLKPGHKKIRKIVNKVLYGFWYEIEYVGTEFYGKFKQFMVSHITCLIFFCSKTQWRRSQWPRGLRRQSAVARLLKLSVRIPPGVWIAVCECCVFSGRGLYNGLITRPEESYRLWCVIVCDLETSWMRRPSRTGGFWAKRKSTKQCPTLSLNILVACCDADTTRFINVELKACKQQAENPKNWIIRITLINKFYV